jgi:hypothetical protein
MREAGFETVDVMRVNTDGFRDSSGRLQKSPWSSQNQLSDTPAWNARVEFVIADTVHFLRGESFVAREMPSVGHAYFDGFDMQQPNIMFEELPITKRRLVVDNNALNGCTCKARLR